MTQPPSHTHHILSQPNLAKKEKIYLFIYLNIVIIFLTLTLNLFEQCFHVKVAQLQLDLQIQKHTANLFIDVENPFFFKIKITIKNSKKL